MTIRAIMEQSFMTIILVIMNSFYCIPLLIYCNSGLDIGKNWIKQRNDLSLLHAHHYRGSTT